MGWLTPGSMRCRPAKTCMMLAERLSLTLESAAAERERSLWPSRKQGPARRAGILAQGIRKKRPATRCSKRRRRPFFRTGPRARLSASHEEAGEAKIKALVDPGG